MEDDARISRLLRQTVVDVDASDTAREQIEQRIVQARRRSHVLRGAGLAAAAAAALAVVVLVEPLGRNAPVIGEGAAEPGAVTVFTACGEVEVDEVTGRYLERWTDGQAEGFAECVLTVVEGPQPRFDTSRLGREQPWLSQPPPDIKLPAPVFMRDPAEGYPFVFIGTNPAHQESDEPETGSLLRWWKSPSAGVIWWCTGKLPEGGGGCGIGARGEYGMGWSGDGPVTIDMLVPDDTAVAVLSIDGRAVAWQRPRGRTIMLAHAPRVEAYTITTYDASGDVIDETPIQE